VSLFRLTGSCLDRSFYIPGDKPGVPGHMRGNFYRIYVKLYINLEKVIWLVRSVIRLACKATRPLI
jgi:hypothetical protein